MRHAHSLVRRATFWISAGLLAWAQVGYGLALAAVRRSVRQSWAPADADDGLPTVSLIIAAHAERDVIAAKVANALALDYPRDKLEIVVACDGSTDGTPEAARAAGADSVLDLPRGGKVAAQDAAVRRSSADLVAFSDANALWEPGALRALVAPFAQDDAIGYVCGRVTFVNPDGGPTKRASTGATRCSCAPASPTWRRSPPATARSTRPVAAPTSRSIP